MAYAFVAVTKIESSTGSSVSSAVSSTASNALFCGAASYTGTTAGSELSCAGGGTWAQDVQITDSTDTANRFKGLIASNPNATGGSQTITVSNGSNNGVTAFIYEFSGNVTSSILDSSPPAVAASTSTTATTNSETNVQASALFFGMMTDADGSNPTTITGTSTGWTYPAGGKETNGSTFQASGTGYKIVSATGAETSAWTVTSSRWDALIACYKASVASGTPYNPWLQRAPILAQ